MRIRSTKPEFWRSKTIAQLDWGTRLVLKGLESYVDDNGVGKDDLALIASDVFPRDLSANPRETLARLSEAISTLFDHALIARYRADGEDLLYIDRWNSQQRIDKPGKGRFPRPDGTFEYQEDVNRDSYAKPRETDGSPPETHAPGTGEQGNRKNIRPANWTCPSPLPSYHRHPSGTLRRSSSGSGSRTRGRKPRRTRNAGSCVSSATSTRRYSSPPLSATELAGSSTSTRRCRTRG